MIDFVDTLTEAVVAAGIGTALFAFLVGSNPSANVMAVFVATAVGCGVYNELLRTIDRPRTALQKVWRGVFYGGATAVLVSMYGVSTLSGLFAAAAVASSVGNVSGQVAFQNGWVS
jgi:hypothetical protein